MKNLIFVALALLFISIITYQPKIFVGTTNRTLAVVDSQENLPLTIEFTHSVQKTPVIEELELQNGEFVLLRTKYKSFGVGLPFDAGDGTFYRDGNWFIMDNMNRHIPNLELRTGKGTKLTITLNGRRFELYKKFPPGTKIIVKRF